MYFKSVEHPLYNFKTTAINRVEHRNSILHRVGQSFISLDNIHTKTNYSNHISSKQLDMKSIS